MHPYVCACVFMYIHTYSHACLPLCVYIYICHRHKNGFRKETTRFQTFVINSYLAWMLAGAQMNHGGSSAHVQWFSHQNGGADVCDIIK